MPKKISTATSESKTIFCLGSEKISESCFISDKKFLLRVCAIDFSSLNASDEYAPVNPLDHFHSIRHPAFDIPKEIEIKQGSWHSIAVPSKKEGISIDGELMNECIMSYVFSVMPNSINAHVISDGAAKSGSQQVVICDVEQMRAVRLHKKWNKIDILCCNSMDLFAERMGELLMQFKDSNGDAIDPIQILRMRSMSGSDAARTITDMSSINLFDWNWLGYPRKVWGLASWKKLRKVHLVV